MFLFESTDCLLILGLHLCECLVPTLVEILVFHQMSLFNLFALSCLIKDQLFTTTIEILHFQFFDAILCHLCLNVLALHFTLFTMFLKDSAKFELSISKK